MFNFPEKIFRFKPHDVHIFVSCRHILFFYLSSVCYYPQYSSCTFLLGYVVFSLATKFPLPFSVFVFPTFCRFHNCGYPVFCSAPCLLLSVASSFQWICCIHNCSSEFMEIYHYFLVYTIISLTCT